MMESKTHLRAAGYTRVSGKHQVEGESLQIQKEKIERYAQAFDYQITKIYSDEGISGKNIKDRPALLELLSDAEAGIFDIVIIYCLDRFGRNSIELQQNYENLKKYKVELASCKERMDFSTHQGKFYYQMLAAMAEMERNNIKERMYSGKYAAAKKGIPPTPRLPFARTYDRKKNKWRLDNHKANIIREAASKYINGESLMDIADYITSIYDLRMTYDHLKDILKKSCGSSWSFTFKDPRETVIIAIPPILEPDVIDRIHNTLRKNGNHTRKDAETKELYLLSGHIRCEKCGRSLMGQSQIGTSKNYRYYQHGSRRDDPCKPKPFSSINADRIENAVMHTIFENFWQKSGFEQAIADNFDTNRLKDLNYDLGNKQKLFKSIEGKINRIVKKVGDGLIRDMEAKEILSTYRDTKATLEQEINKLKHQLKLLNDKELTKFEAEILRRQLVEKYSNPERLNQMTFKEKRKLLTWLFEGKAPNGDPYGIYVTKKGNGKTAEINYFMFGRITGLRTLKGEDIDYFDPAWIEDMKESNILENNKIKNQNYKTKGDQFVNNLI